MSARPYMKFFISDWRGDTRLSGCSRPAQFLWFEMLMIMHEAQPYGHLRVGNVVLSTPKTIANELKIDPKEAALLIEELENRGVFNRLKSGEIISRRMLRDAQKSADMRALSEQRWDERNAKRNAVPDNVPQCETQCEDKSAPDSLPQSTIVHSPESIVQSHNSNDQERGVEAAASPAPVKPRMIRPMLPEVAPDAFGALEPDVAIFVALAAAENKTGAISTGRIESIRRELAAVREEYPGAFLAALREANTRGKPSVNYLRAIAKGRRNDTPSLVANPEKIDDEPMPQYIREAIELHDRDFGGASAGGAA